MRFRVKWRNVLALACAILLFCGTFLLFMIWLLREQPCGLMDSRQYMRAICHSYEQGIIDGKICPLLCRSVWRLRRCLGHLTGKRVLLFERDAGRQPDYATGQLANPELTSVVVKSSQWTVQFRSGKMAPHLTWIQETRRLLTTAVAQIFLRQPDSEELMREFWDQSLLSDEPPSTSVLKNSVWALADQREYILLKHLSESNLVPTLLGTCGPLYGVTDSSPPPELRLRLLPLGSHPVNSWVHRAFLALQILRLLRSLEMDSRPPLLLCDMKADNFGVSGDGSLRLLDLDTVFVEEDLFSRDCTGDAECTLFACAGECVDGRCRRQRGFSALMAACRAIFVGAAINGWRGLLSGSPRTVTRRVDAALERCLRPPPRRSVRDAYRDLEHSLMRTVFDLREEKEGS